MQYSLSNILFLDKKPLAYDKWQEVFKRMSVHTQGAIPVHIFEERRPMESANEAVLEYRSKNFRPITKNEFDKAIFHYLDLAQNIDVTIDYKTSLNKGYIDNLIVDSGLKKLKFKEWFFKNPATYRQTDPNAVVVVLAKHPTDIFAPTYEKELPNFFNIENNKIDVEIKLITYNNIKHIDTDNLIFIGGDYKYSKNDSAPYYYHITKEKTLLYLPKKGEHGLSYNSFLYYNNNLKYVPFSVIGGKMVIEQQDNTLLEYYVSDFSGAAAYGDLAIGQNSDLQISEVRFVFPKHWKIKRKCDNVDNGCHLDQNSGRYVISENKICSRCKGTGYVVDDSPMGTEFIDAKDLEDGKFNVPEGFISPPSEILKHAADRVAYYIDKTISSLGLFKQNMTSQSGESKSYDYMHTLSMNTYIVTDLYVIYEYLLNVIDNYRTPNKLTQIDILFPDDFDIKEANDILFEITDAKKNNLPNSIIVELTKKYYLKKFGKSIELEKIVNFLAKYDKLFIYGISDISQNQLTGITDKDRLVHNLAYQILVDYSKMNDNIIVMSFEEIAKIVESEINKIPIPISVI